MTLYNLQVSKKKKRDKDIQYEEAWQRESSTKDGRERLLPQCMKAC